MINTISHAKLSTTQQGKEDVELSRGVDFTARQTSCKAINSSVPDGLQISKAEK